MAGGAERRSIDDPERVFLTSEFVRLEVLPKAIYFHWQDELDVYENFFTSIAEIIPLSDALLTQAHLEARHAGLVPSAVLTQRVALVAARRISRAASFSCTSIESVLDDN